MDEIARCCEILGVQSGLSLEELKVIYRDLVQVWHPDRFGTNDRLRLKAEEKLKEINRAYEYLLAHGFQDGRLSFASNTPGESPSSSPEEPKEPPAAEQTQSEEPPQKSSLPLVFSLALLVVAGVILLLWFALGSKQHPPKSIAEKRLTASGNEILLITPNPATNEAQASHTNSPQLSPPVRSQLANGFFSEEILPAMTRANQIETSAGPEGVALKSTGDRDYIQYPQPLHAPLTIRIRARTDVKDLRIYYGLGEVIFNWESNPAELRVHDPVTARISAVHGQGMLSANEWHELVWEITTNANKVIVDGQLRFEGKGDYRRINGFPAIGPFHGEALVQSVVLETPLPLELLKTNPPSRRIAVLGDQLEGMVPINGPKIIHTSEGIMLAPGATPDPSLKTVESFRPPFVIRTRAKIDSNELRLYCGSGMVILDWSDNPLELRVHDPLTGQPSGIPAKGFIYPNEWHDIIWEIAETGMQLSVDGRPRFQNRKDYRALNATVGIGPSRSKLTVEYFVVQKK